MPDTHRASGRVYGREELNRQSIGEFLRQLAARVAAPGAGATAAIEAALAASLVAMVGRFTTNEEHADLVDEIVAAADAQRDVCLAAAADDEAAYSAVAEAMKMPGGTSDEQEARRHRLSQAQLDATRPPLGVLGSAAELVSLAGRVLPIANHNLVSDVAAATAAARAAASTARLAVEANLLGIDDEGSGPTSPRPSPWSRTWPDVRTRSRPPCGRRCAGDPSACRPPGPRGGKRASPEVAGEPAGASLGRIRTVTDAPAGPRRVPVIHVTGENAETTAAQAIDNLPWGSGLRVGRSSVRTWRRCRSASSSTAFLSTARIVSARAHGEVAQSEDRVGAAICSILRTQCRLISRSRCDTAPTSGAISH